jgi:hypothetical protein
MSGGDQKDKLYNRNDLLEQKGDAVHDHDLDESFRVKIPSHLRKLIEGVVRGYTYKQVLTTVKACDENGK